MLDNFITWDQLKKAKYNTQLNCILEDLFCEYTCKESVITLVVDGAKINTVKDGVTTLLIDLEPIIAAEVTKQIAP